jgi:mercuric ion transport protein
MTGESRHIPAGGSTRWWGSLRRGTGGNPRFDMLPSPLVLVVLGVSGAWIGNLTKLEPYRPYFIGAAMIALFFAGRRIFRPATECKPGEVCALPQTRRVYKIVFGIVSVLVFIALVFPYLVRFFY